MTREVTARNQAASLDMAGSVTNVRKSVSPIAPAWLDRRRWDTRGQSRGFKRHERPPQNVRRIEQHRLTYRAQGECLEAGRFGDKNLATPADVCCRVEKPQERRPIRKGVNRADRDKFACSSLVWPDWFGAAGRSQVRTLEARQAQLRIVTIWLTLQRDTKGMCPGRQSEVRSGLSQ